MKVKNSLKKIDYTVFTRTCPLKTFQQVERLNAIKAKRDADIAKLAAFYAGRPVTL